MMHRVLGLVLAGGKGTRLEPLTRDRAKPAVPFGGAYRIIDFTLSNCINSGMRKILVLTQFKSVSLDRHLNLGWRFLCRELHEYIDVLPPQQRIDENWYQGTADAVYQNIYSIEQSRSDYIVILSGDHIYKMDYSDLIEDHIQSKAALTIACIPCSLEEGREFGVMQVDPSGRIVDFEEKPSNPKSIPGHPGRCLASMGIYVFNTKFLFDQLCQDATSERSRLRQERDSRIDRFSSRPRVSVSRQKHGAQPLLARRGNAGCLLRSKHGSCRGRTGTEFVRPDMATQNIRSPGTAAKVRLFANRGSQSAPGACSR